MNSDKFEEILSKEDCKRMRTSQQLSEWIDEKLKLLYELSKQNKDIKRKVILRKGLFKQFYEEVYPLSLFGQYYYRGRTDILFKPKLGDDAYDAIMLDSSENPIYRIEITQAHPGHEEYLRMEYFLNHGHVPILGNLTYEGTRKTGHKINIENEGAWHTEVVEKVLMLIDKALQGKANKPEQHYNTDTLLLVVFDDYIVFRSDKDKTELNKFVREKIVSSNLNFEKIFLVGWSGKSFYEFSVNQRK